LFNGLNAYTFNFPGVVRDLISTQVEEHSILETQSAVSRGIQRTMFPVQVRETGDAQFMTDKNVEVELHLSFHLINTRKFAVKLSSHSRILEQVMDLQQVLPSLTI
jgi:hypothetical protein